MLYRNTLIFCLIGLTSRSGWAQTDLKVERLTNEINTERYDEISPVVSVDGSTLYFTRVAYPEFDKTLVVDGKNLAETLPVLQYESTLRSVYSSIAQKNVIDPAGSDFNQDVWVAKVAHQEAASVLHPGHPLNNALPNSICALTPDPDAFVVINQFPEEGGLRKGFSVIKRLEDGSWSYPRPLHIQNYYTKSEGVSLTMSIDGEALLMSIERDDSYGSNDLYVSFRIDDSTYTAPRNLGVDINSQARESTPALSEDKNTLYFASNRPGLGGTDIYMAKRLDDSWTNWSYPRRFIAPINSAADDSQPYFNAATGNLFFSSRRAGSSDIYRVQILPPEPQQQVTLKGQIFDLQTKELLDAKVLIGPVDAADFDQSYISRDGTFQVNLPVGQSIKLVAQRKGYFGQVIELDLSRNRYYSTDPTVTLWLDPLNLHRKIALRPIYFERSKPLILSKSYPELDHLAQVLAENSGIHILIEGHTDNLGAKPSLVQLSEERADAVKTFLINRGIEGSRISIKGLGGDRPVNDNSTEELREQNRRVEVQETKRE